MTVQHSSKSVTTYMTVVSPSRSSTTCRALADWQVDRRMHARHVDGSVTWNAPSLLCYTPCEICKAFCSNRSSLLCVLSSSLNPSSRQSFTRFDVPPLLDFLRRLMRAWPLYTCGSPVSLPLSTITPIRKKLIEENRRRWKVTRLQTMLEVLDCFD